MTEEKPVEKILEGVWDSKPLEEKLKGDEDENISEYEKEKKETLSPIPTKNSHSSEKLEKKIEGDSDSDDGVSIKPNIWSTEEKLESKKVGKKTKLDKKDKPHKEKKFSKFKKITTATSLFLLAWGSYYMLSNSNIEYFRKRRKNNYSNEINKIDKKIKNSQFIEANNLSDNLQKELNDETHDDFKSLRTQLKGKDDYLIDPEVVNLRFDEIKQANEKGNFAKAKELSNIVLNKFKNEPSKEVESSLTQINEYKNKTIEKSLKELMQANKLKKNYHDDYSNLIHNLGVYDKKELTRLKLNLDSLLKKYVSLKQDVKPIKNLITKVNDSVKSCENMEKKLLKVDNLFFRCKRSYNNLPQPDIDSTKFKALSNDLKIVLEDYQEIKAKDKVKPVQEIIKDVNESIKICTNNKQKFKVYSEKFLKIKGLISRKKYNKIDSEIKNLFNNLKKENFSSKVTLLNKIRNFNYNKTVFVPARLENQKKVMGGFYEKIWQCAEYKIERPFFGKARKVQTRSSRYRKGKWIPPIYDSIIVPAKKQIIKVSPYKNLEKLIKEIPTKNKKESQLEKKFKDKWAQNFLFDTENKNSFKKRNISFRISNKEYGLKISAGHILYITIYDKSTFNDFLSINVLVSPYSDAYSDKTTKLISSDGNQYLIMSPSQGNNFVKFPEIVNGIISKDLMLDNGILNLSLQINSWGKLKGAHKIGSGGSGSTSSIKYHNSITSYSKYKISGKARIAFYPISSNRNSKEIYINLPTPEKNSKKIKLIYAPQGTKEIIIPGYRKRYADGSANRREAEAAGGRFSHRAGGSGWNNTSSNSVWYNFPKKKITKHISEHYKKIDEGKIIDIIPIMKGKLKLRKQ